MDPFEFEVETVKRSVELIGQHFTKPDDDWRPTLLVVGPKPVISPLQTVPKQLWPTVVAAVVNEVRGEFAAVVLSSWQLKVEKADATPEVLARFARTGIRNEADRTEALMIECSDGKQLEVWSAPITRHEDAPPTLGEWRKWPNDPSGPRAGMTLGAFAARRPMQ